jgi:diguanylate cyclase (GGDEF)-like protein/PAS domain S-box-containing protein
LIDDDPRDVELALRSLRAAGFLVTWEHVQKLDGVLQAVHSRLWDVILSDHAMPGFSSRDVLALLASLELPAPLIVVSGAIGEQEAVDLLHRGAASYVDKDKIARLGSTVVRVVTAERVRREHLIAQRQLELVQAAVNGANDLICVLETQDHGPPLIAYVNDAAERLTGYSAIELMARGFAGLHGTATDGDAVDRLTANMARGDSLTVELLLHHKNGSTNWVETGVRPLAGGSGRFVSVSRDISERKNAEAQLAFLASHDPLTLLANRALLADRLALELAHARRNGHQVAVLMIDIDGFKTVNDTLGHEFGDGLLREVAERVQSCVREVDTVARLGGDEFVVVLGSVERLDHVERVAERILQLARKPVALPGGTCTISVSIGISTYPTDGDVPSVLVKRADEALYRVKAEGKDAFRSCAV